MSLTRAACGLVFWAVVMPIAFILLVVDRLRDRFDPHHPHPL